MLWSPVAAADPPPMTATERQATQEASRRGALIYAYDQAAWHGTDDMAKKIRDFQDRVGGWVVDGPAESPTLVFFDRNEADPQVVYVAKFESGKLASSRVLGEADDRTLSPDRKQLILARSAAFGRFLSSGSHRCSAQPFNTVVLPPQTEGGPVLVYLLTPQPALDAIPFGGHYLVEVQADGTASPPRKFANSCLVMQVPKALKKGKAKPVALTVTHLLDPAPTEIHVFSSFAARLPVMVGTTANGKVWSVERSKIELIALMDD